MLDAGMSKNQKKFELSGFFVFTKTGDGLSEFLLYNGRFFKRDQSGVPKILRSKVIRIIIKDLKSFW